MASNQELATSSRADWSNPIGRVEKGNIIKSELTNIPGPGGKELKQSAEVSLWVFAHARASPD